MDLGLNIAASGMLAEQVQEDQYANDLANAATPGYKPGSSEQRSFGSLLLYNTQNGQQVGSIATGVEVQKGPADMAQGPLASTGRPLDFALSGQGFFAVRTANGVEYTRNGEFSKNSQGLLVDQFGDEVLSRNGGPIPVGADGSVPPTALGVFNLKNPTQLGNNNFSGTLTGTGTGSVQVGYLEGSGIDSIQAMVDMESSLNAYTAGQQSISTISNTLQESASEVAALP